MQYYKIIATYHENKIHFPILPLVYLQRRDRAKGYHRSRTDGPSLTYIKREACGIGCKPNLQSRRNPSVGHPACSAYTNKKVFAPEHGFRGDADAGETIRNGKDTRTGIPILSLYGKNKKPTATQLQDIDLIVFDIQDVGARFYTYISTMQYVMEACAENQKQLVITDRPNPCDYVDGPVRQKNQKSFVGMHAIPILHGCTVGELAQMINGEGWLPNGKKCALTVIPVEGWKHGQPYSLPVKPSPNLPNDQAIALYPSLCPFEGTAISVGRGTLYPFQVIGSPDIRISSFSFRPEALEGFDKNPMYKNQYCYGNNLRHITAPKGFSLKYIITYYQAYQDLGKADKFFTRPQWFDLLIGNRTVREQIMKGASEEEIRAGWQNELEAYKR